MHPPQAPAFALAMSAGRPGPSSPTVSRLAPPVFSAAGPPLLPPTSQPTVRPPLKTSRKAAERIFVDGLAVGTLDNGTLMTGFRSTLPPVQHADGSASTSSFLDIDFEKGCFFFRLFCHDSSDCGALYPLEGEILFLDVATRGVSVQRAMRDGVDVVDLMVTSRRPPKLWVRLKELIAVPEGDDGEEMASRWKRERRQATELDYARADEVMEERTVMSADDRLEKFKVRVKRQKMEGDAGPVSVLRARQEDYELVFEVRQAGPLSLTIHPLRMWR